MSDDVEPACEGCGEEILSRSLAVCRDATAADPFRRWWHPGCFKKPRSPRATTAQAETGGPE